MFKLFFSRNLRKNMRSDVAIMERGDRQTGAQRPSVAVNAPTVTPTRTRTAVRRQTQASPEREDLMYELTDEALKRGIAEKELKSMNVGNCAAQVETRINSLTSWLNKNPA